MRNKKVCAEDRKAVLKFEALTLDCKPMVDGYFYRWGEGSCQHSFVNLFCMQEKYGDLICERDGFLFVLRQGKCTDEECVCLLPMGERKELRRAVERLLEYAHAQNRRLRLETVTRSGRDLLLSLFPDVFTAEESRDYAEYIYSREKLALLPGHELACKRHDVNTFFRDYGDRAVIAPLREEEIGEILAFQKRWLEEKERGVEDVQLECENAAIRRGLAHFEELNLRGVTVRVGGELMGYAYGAPLNDDCFDVIIEKGDRSIPDVYRVLNRELVRLCCGEYDFINREEDVGVPGLRRAKLSYRPDKLLEKFIVKETTEHE